MDTWLQALSQQMRNVTFFGQVIQTVVLNSGDSLVIPTGAIGIARPLEASSLSLIETFANKESIEELVAATTNPETLNAMRKTLMQRDDHRQETRRVDAIIKQIQKGQKKKKPKSKK